MKTTIPLFLFLIITGAFFIRGTRVMRDIKLASDYQFPVEVKAVIDKKCYGCHSLKGKLPKAKKAMMWDSIPLFSNAKLVARLDKIIDVLDDGTMPPEEVVKKYPEAALLPEEREILKNWAEATSDSLMN